MRVRLVDSQEFTCHKIEFTGGHVTIDDRYELAEEQIIRITDEEKEE